MAYPNGVALAVLTLGAAGDFFGGDAVVSAKVTPVLGGTSHLVHKATGDVMVPTSMDFVSEPGGVLSVSVPIVDQPGWVDASGQEFTGWSYRVVVTVQVAKSRSISWDIYVSPVTGQALVDLDMVPVSGKPGTPTVGEVPTVLSVLGKTGAITAADLAAAGLGGGESLNLAAANEYADQAVSTADSKNRADWANADQATLAEAKKGLWSRGTLPANTDTTTMRGADWVGVWNVATAPDAAGIIGLPVNKLGSLTVYPGTGWQEYRTYGDGRRWSRGLLSATTGAWTAWRDELIPGFLIRGTLPGGADLNDYKTEAHEGYWRMSSTSVAGTIANIPEAVAGILRVEWMGGVIAAQTYTTYGTGHIWVRSVLNSGGTAWSTWRDLTAKPEVPAPPPVVHYAVDRAARVAAAVQRVGGSMGTGGKAAFMLRFDDYPDTLLSKVVPILEKYDLPCYWAATVNHVENLSSVSWGQLNTVAVQSGVQMTGHSWSHGNATDEAGIRRELVESADYFEQMMPACKIDVWTQPSVGGAVPYDGYDGKTTTLRTTLAGKLLLGRYAVVNGSEPGFYHPMGGGPDAALCTANLTYETHTLDQFKTYVDEGIAAGTMTDLMLHPGRLDTSGYMSTDTLDACLGYLAQRRNAGDLLVVSGLAKLALDGSHSRRSDLLGTDFTKSTSGWTKTTVSGGVATVSPASEAVHPVHADRYTGLRGSVREYMARVRCAAADRITLTVRSADSSFLVTKTYDVPAGDWVTVRKFLMIPANLPSGWLYFTLKSETGARFDVAEAHAFAV